MMASRLYQSASRFCATRVTPTAFQTASKVVANSFIGSSTGMGGGFNQHAAANNNPLDQQVRFRMTKAKRKRLIRHKRRAVWADKGKELQKPPGYEDRLTEVTNVIPRTVTQELIRVMDEKDRVELEERRNAVMVQTPLRHHMTGLTMSDRVRKLFDMNNGNQKEVVQYQKQTGMQLFEMREGDTGSSAVQVVALTSRIQQLQTHMRTHKKDKSTKRGLLRLTVRRRKVLDYLERMDFDSYRRVVKSLGLARR